MGIATLMVHLQPGQPNTAVLTAAAVLAERLRAGVTAIALCQPMRIIYNDGYIPPEVFALDQAQIDSDMQATEAEFRAALDGSGLAVDWRPVVTSEALSAYLADESYGTDLMITGVDRPTSLFDTSRHVDIGDFVMQAGRPCLIVPAELERFSLDHVVVGWKNGRETRRAISDALPLLAVAGRVSVVSITAKEDVAAAQARLAGVAGWLRLHGIAAEVVVASAMGDDAAQLGTIAQDLGATLLVAGAYGHSRVREWALGGVTRDLLLRPGRCALVSH